MKDIKCPLCRLPLKLSTIENKGQLHFYACYKCNYQLRMSLHKDFALEYAEAFVSLFPPIMRIKAGDNVKIYYDDDIFTVVSVNITDGRILLQDCYGEMTSARPDNIGEWPWELEQKGGNND